ncbi:RNA-splicing ligase RtcB [Paractinoplanes abujensis]|uniref:tRNA-splicing ligase RtcB n=1 Tax=Paractinoplanes abujensis TaxID=882441 RepID=A0A7W7CNR6_9ACTN|nr:RtcB family protein [Actinoplanes abujensis]MBB4691932.1 tRNA-splicing ligase RtcB [Actinoplanes abujensis]GID16649.1 RNA-splicing ligase RtcB [Actinoplanes abujensis]
MSKRQDRRLVRTDDSWLTLPNPYDVPAEICAGPGVPIEPAAVDELLTVLETARTLDTLAAATPGLTVTPRVDRVVGTPDFHKGAGIPIGTVLRTAGALVPQAVGNDINCGMRVEVTSLTADSVRPRLDELETRLRHLFFEGGRRIGLTPAHREGLLRHGLPGLLAEGVPAGAEGVWRQAGPGDTGGRLHSAGQPATSADEFRDWIDSGGGTSYDSIIGSVGGGNHFAELQYVTAIHDSRTAYEWGLSPGRVVLMVHTGSLSLGHQANATGLTQARAAWPRAVPMPANRILPMLLDDRNAAGRERYLTAFTNAANFAVGNRFFLALMLRAGLAEAVGALSSQLIYDAPHNLLWPGEDGSVVHRKGATPAGAGEPVIVPGSMGAASCLLRGLGNGRSLESACHGAGRSIPRGATARGGDAELDAFLRDFRVVTPLNHRDPALAGRRDVLDAWRRDLKQEAPWAYKEVGPVVGSLQTAGVADPVAELKPLLTVKG